MTVALNASIEYTLDTENTKHCKEMQIRRHDILNKRHCSFTRIENYTDMKILDWKYVDI